MKPSDELKKYIRNINWYDDMDRKFGDVLIASIDYKVLVELRSYMQNKERITVDNITVIPTTRTIHGGGTMIYFRKVNTWRNWFIYEKRNKI